MNQDQPPVQEQRQAGAGRQLGDRPPADGPPARRQGRRRDVADPPVRLPGPQRQGRVPGRRQQEPELQQGQVACERQHLRGGNCRFWTFNTSFGPTVAQVVQYDLKQIGLNCEITPLDRVVETTKGGIAQGAQFDLLLNGWGQDYPDPYDFINILLDGSGIKPDNNVNLSYFNQPSWNKKIAARRRSSPAQPATRRTPSSTMTSWPARRRLLRTSTRTPASSCPSVWVATCTRRRTAPSSTPPASASGRETHYVETERLRALRLAITAPAAIEFLPRTNSMRDDSSPMFQYLFAAFCGRSSLFLTITMVAYVIFFIIPANPAKLACGQRASPECIRNATQNLGLDKPVYVQYGKLPDEARGPPRPRQVVFQPAERERDGAERGSGDGVAGAGGRGAVDADRVCRSGSCRRCGRGRCSTERRWCSC